MKALAAGLVLLLASGCAVPSDVKTDPTANLTGSDFLATAHNNGTLPVWFVLDLRVNGSTFLTEEKQAMGGETVSWTTHIPAHAQVKLQLDMRGITGSGGFGADLTIDLCHGEPWQAHFFGRSDLGADWYGGAGCGQYDVRRVN